MAPESGSPYRLAVAPMMDWTTRHCRTLHRLLAPRALLFTEMIVADALVHGGKLQLLTQGESPHPVACQLGGSDEQVLAEAAVMVQAAGYDEVNLNVGCPSDRVQQGMIGACLMAHPHLVARCVAAMKAATGIRVTVKCRLGIDNLDSQADLTQFVQGVADAGADALYLHARIAMLNGLTPAQNRSIPPLQPQRVYAIKAAFPDLPVVYNGGISSVAEAREHLAHVDGVMVGRAAYQQPLLLSAMHTALLGPAPDHEAAIAEWLRYLEAQSANGTPLHAMTRHMLGLYSGQPGARQFRRLLSDQRRLREDGIHCVRDALNAVTRAGVAA